jgi:hypothetical protein|tara:strand:- start:584 stop:1543 length:960 start_codon:yes stop_codon:yes gene_type:complete
MSINKLSGVTFSTVNRVDGIRFSDIDKISGVRRSYFLDDFSGARAAYSLRQLSFTATNAIRVRNSSGSEADIGFDSDGNLDVASLNLHCGSNSGQIAKWYDQSGNSEDMVQTVQSKMPYIKDASGTTYTMSDGSNEPSIYFYSGSSSQWLDNASFVSNNTDHMVISSVVEFDTVTTGQQILSQWSGTQSSQAFQLSMLGASSKIRLSNRVSTGGLIRTQSPTSSSTISADTTYSVVAYASVTPYEGDVDINGDTASEYPFTNASTGTLNAPTSTMTIGRRSDNGAAPLQGMVSEMVVWSDTTLPDRNSIMTNVKNYYGV